MRTLRFLLEKEFRQFARNPFLPRMAVFFPVMVMLVMPWVATMDIRQVNIAVVDNDRSFTSQRFIQKIGASDYFTLQEVSSHYALSLATLEAGDADLILEIPDRFERDLMAGNPRNVAISANGVNALKGGIGSQYLGRVVDETLAELRREAGGELPAVQMTVQNRYNPTLDYRSYMIPALMNMLLVILCGFLPTLNLVSEKETGTIEQINVTPVSRLTFTLGKLIPYWLLGLVVLTVSILIAWGVYGLTTTGNLVSIYIAAMLFIFVMSGVGVIVANNSSSMQQSMFVMFFIVMIFMLMSGLFTPIESMPRWAQEFTRIVPPRYFIEVLRSVYLKGTQLPELWPKFAALGGFALVFSLWAGLSYKKQT